MQSCTYLLRPRNSTSPPPCLGSYKKELRSAKIGDISLWPLVQFKIIQLCDLDLCEAGWGVMWEAAHSISYWNIISTFVTPIDDNSVVVDKSVLPTGRIFGHRTQKGQRKTMSGPSNLRPRFGRIFTKGAEKRPIFSKFIFLTFSLLSQARYQT